MKDYYSILGVSKNATDEEIKKAYRKLAHQYHPDKTGGDEKKFKEINEAYQVLSNKEKRAQYDRFGTVFEGAPQGAGYAHTGFGTGGFNWNVNIGDMGGFDDIFETIFSHFGGGRARQTYTHGSDIEISHTITLEDAFRGSEKRVRFYTNITCDACGGEGKEKGTSLKECAVCKGRGEVREQKQTFFGNFSQVKACGACFGRGSVPEKPCRKCNGRGRARGEREVAFTIPRGIEDGQVIKISGFGEAGEYGSRPGDLYVVVHVRPHAVFRRKKNDLYMEKTLKFTDAALGKKITLTDISGETFSVSLPPGFNLRETLRVPGRGMPRFNAASASRRGDLYVTFNVKTPKKLSERARKLLEELDKEL